MFEFHGWAVIEAEEHVDATSQLEANRLAKEFTLAAVAAAQDGISSIDFAEGGNGLAVVRLHGLRNHRRDEAITLFRKIAAHLPDSYGVLYIHDPEKPPHSDSFRVFRMARGRVEEFADSLLSPRIPVIEDEFGE